MHTEPTFADDLELHAIQHRRTKIVEPIWLLFVVCLRRPIKSTVFDVRRDRAIDGLAGNFRRRHVRVVVVDVMVIVVHDGTLAAEVAVGANQAFLGRNVIVAQLGEVALTLDGNERRLCWWDR